MCTMNFAFSISPLTYPIPQTPVVQAPQNTETQMEKEKRKWEEEEEGNSV